MLSGALFKYSCFRALRYISLEMQFFPELPRHYPYQPIHSLFNLSAGLVWELCRRLNKTVSPPNDLNAFVPNFTGLHSHLLYLKEAHILACIEKCQNCGEYVSPKKLRDFTQKICNSRPNLDQPPRRY
jgi:hypothetical protein